MKINKPELKACRILSKEEAFELLLSQELGCSESWKKYLKKKSKEDTFVMFKDGLYVVFNRPTIESTMYYDDEYDAPSTAFNSFKAYNMDRRAFYNINKWVEMRNELKVKGFCSGEFGSMWLAFTYSDKKKNECCIRYGDSKYGVKAELDDYFVRYLTEEEQEDMVMVNEYCVKMFEKRLETYYKKYHDKIYTHGYWANR